MNRYYLVMTFTVCHGKSTHAIKNGKPSISIRTISHGYVSHNQRVTVTMNNRSSWVQLGPYPTNKVTRISKNLEYIISPNLRVSIGGWFGTCMIRWAAPRTILMGDPSIYWSTDQSEASPGVEASKLLDCPGGNLLLKACWEPKGGWTCLLFLVLLFYSK